MQAEIALVDLEFYSYHGFYEEERKTGNKFSVDLRVETDIPEDQNFDDINVTVNYEDLYSIVKTHMNLPSSLLENIAHKILGEVFSKWKNVKVVTISISKYTPPIGGICKKAMVTLKKNR